MKWPYSHKRNYFSKNLGYRKDIIEFGYLHKTSERTSMDSSDNLDFLDNH